jgi:hypothetical protein
MAISFAGQVRCDWCGRRAADASGRYTRPDGMTLGYIMVPEWDGEDSGRHVCDECSRGRCPDCGEEQPLEWARGGRCAKCGREWSY